MGAGRARLEGGRGRAGGVATGLGDGAQQAGERGDDAGVGAGRYDCRSGALCVIRAERELHVP